MTAGDRLERGRWLEVSNGDPGVPQQCAQHEKGAGGAALDASDAGGPGDGSLCVRRDERADLAERVLVARVKDGAPGRIGKLHVEPPIQGAAEWTPAEEVTSLAPIPDGRREGQIYVGLRLWIQVFGVAVRIPQNG